MNTLTLKVSDLIEPKELLALLFNSAVSSCLPANCLKNYLQEREYLKQRIQMDIESGQVSFVSIGKAGFELAKCFIEMFESGMELNGFVSTKHGHSKGSLKNTSIMESSHPIPGMDSVEAGLKLIDFLSNTKSRDIVFLISGGGSSLLEVPIENESLESIQRLTDDLLKSGKTIQEVNQIRKKYSKIKGGKLLNFLPENVKTVSNFILSDVIGDDLSSISSGLSIPSESTIKPERFKLENHLIAGNSLAMTACVNKAIQWKNDYAKELNLEIHLSPTPFIGEAREIGKQIAEIGQNESNKNQKSPCSKLYICGGESTVTIKGSGKGGRNQEMAYQVALCIEDNYGIYFLSAGTDGTDGPTDVAGGIVDGNTIAKIRSKSSSDPLTYLKENDSYHALELAGDLLVTGPTGTNVNDIAILLVDP